ncbi:HAD hydrolase-like protein [Brevibacillus massiliensis]|uniref:HAD hydrolase-like protein n=1 Tax=Brevibacillus massiliensis TaxID=1118054 RepID=UPI0002E4C83E|nr:HAD hydrolase-like protein [Brevibacillus massiliensis]
MTIRHAIFFDMDGTLLQTEKLAVPAFRRTFDELRERNLWSGETPDDAQLTNVLGMTLAQLWDTLLPGASEEVKVLADELMLNYEVELLRAGATELYPGAVELLQAFYDQGIALFVTSNGLEHYVEAICEHFQMKHLFTDLYSAGRFKTASKKDLVAKLLQDYSIQEAVMVGDRRSDVEAGKANRLFTIGCDFGFAKDGELDGADVIVREFRQIADHIPFFHRV